MRKCELTVCEDRVNPGKLNDGEVTRRPVYNLISGLKQKISQNNHGN